tara:strand:+ start:4886 stop:6517 length:1632 start_codon:yes stop_codon:yes gene_type:complete
MDPFTPILFLSIGAIAVLIGSNRSYGFYGFTASIAIVGAIAATLLLGYRTPATVVLSPWQTQSVFLYPLSLTIDKASWFLALLLVMTIMCLLSISLSVHLNVSPKERAVCLMVVALALLALFSDNLITLVLALTVLDVFNGLFAFVSNHRSNLSRGIKKNLQMPEIVRFGINVLSIGLVLLVALDGHAQTFSIGDASILIIVAMIRINIYPVNAGLVLSHFSSRVVATVISLVNVIIAVNILVLFGLYESVTTLRSVLTVLAIMSGLVGGYRWCTATKHVERLHSFLLAQIGLIVLTFLWAGDWAVVGVFSHMISMALSVLVIYVSGGLFGSTTARYIKPLLTGLVFGCQPLTAGFFGVFVLYSGLIDYLAWSMFVVPSIIVINGLTMVGGWRLLQLPFVDRGRQPPIVVLAKVLAIGVPLLASLAVGIIPSKFSSLLGLPITRFWVNVLNVSGLTALGSSVMSASLAMLLWYYRSTVLLLVKNVSESRLRYVADVRWLHLAIWRIYRDIGKSLRVPADILEGQGGILWSLVIVFAILLVVGV